MVIYIITYQEDGEVILSATSEKLAIMALDKWNGAESVNKPQNVSSRMIRNKKIEYSEFQGTLERILTYEDLETKEKTTFDMWCIDLITNEKEI